MPTHSKDMQCRVHRMKYNHIRSYKDLSLLYSVSLSLPAAQQDSGVASPETTLNPGHPAQLHTAVINQSKLDLRLLNYLAQDWSSEYRFDLFIC